MRFDEAMRDERAMRAWLAEVGERVSEHGVRAEEQALAEVGAAARRLGVRPVAVEVLTEPSEPDVARERALVVVSSMLVRALRSTAHPSRRAVAA